MKRSTLAIGLAVVGLGAANWLTAGAPAPQAKAAPRAADLCEKLQQPISLDKPIENAPLKDVLEFLSEALVRLRREVGLAHRGQGTRTRAPSKCVRMCVRGHDTAK